MGVQTCGVVNFYVGDDPDTVDAETQIDSLHGALVAWIVCQGVFVTARRAVRSSDGLEKGEVPARADPEETEGECWETI